MEALYTIVLAGGTGSRLWPISTPERPKQFIKYQNKTFLDHTIERALALSPNCVVVSQSIHESHLQNSLYKDVITLLQEPCGRNTTAAVAYAAYSIFQQNPHAVICVMPCDHVISDQHQFIATLLKSFELAAQKKNIVMIGVPPTFPSTDYGYINVADEHNGFYSINKFIEKPEYSVAKDLIDHGHVLWNSGIIVADVKVVLELLEEHASSIMKLMKEFFLVQDPAIYEKIDSLSFDRAVLEKADTLLCVKAGFEWCDAGSVENFLKATTPFAHVTLENSSQVLAYASKPIFINNVNNVVIVETEQAIIISTAEDFNFIYRSSKKNTEQSC